MKANDGQCLNCPAGDIDSLLDQYNTGIVALMNKHAPTIRRTIHVRARQPWRTDDLQQMRQETRRAERRWRRTRLVVHREIYTDASDAFKRRIAMKRHSYHRTAFTIGQDDQHPGQVTGTQLVRLATGDTRKSLYS